MLIECVEQFIRYACTCWASVHIFRLCCRHQREACLWYLIGMQSVVGSRRWEWVPDYASKFCTGFQKVIKCIICIFNRVFKFILQLFQVGTWICFPAISTVFHKFNLFIFQPILRFSLFTIAILKIEFLDIVLWNFSLRKNTF